MRYRLLWRAMLIVNFAKGSVHPMSSAIGRIMFGYVALIVLAILLIPAVSRIDIPKGLPWLMVSNVICISGFVLGGLISITMQTSSQNKSRQTTLGTVIHVFPLPRRVRWLVRIVPNLIILTMLGICGAILLSQISRDIGYGVLSYSSLTLIGLLLLALFSGYGLTLLTYLRSILVKTIVYVLLVTLSVILFNKSLNIDSIQQSSIVWWVVDLICLAPMAGYWQNYRQSGKRLLISTQATTLALIPGYISAKSWFFVKIWRNLRTRNSLMLAVLLNSTIALVLIVRRITPSDPYGILFFGAMLASTFAGDVRGVIRRYLPPEMVLLRGLRGMVWSEIIVVLWCGVAIGLPVMLALVAHADNAIWFLLYYLVLQIFAVMAGLMASTLLVPASGETGVQFFTGILATVVLAGFPKLAKLSQINYINQCKYWLMAGILLGFGSYIIETIRRKSYGRS